MTDTDDMPNSGEERQVRTMMIKSNRAARSRSVLKDIEANTRACHLIANCNVLFLDGVYSRQNSVALFDVRLLLWNQAQFVMQATAIRIVAVHTIRKCVSVGKLIRKTLPSDPVDRCRSNAPQLSNPSQSSVSGRRRSSLPCETLYFPRKWK